MIIDLSSYSVDFFDESKVTLYKNLMKLMPFYSEEKIVKLADTVNDENLKNKEISNILPVDSKGNVVTYLTTDDVKKISNNITFRIYW